jgi:glycerol-3-phosphate responsive antiterminator
VHHMAELNNPIITLQINYLMVLSLCFLHIVSTITFFQNKKSEIYMNTDGINGLSTR